MTQQRFVGAGRFGLGKRRREGRLGFAPVAVSLGDRAFLVAKAAEGIEGAPVNPAFDQASGIELARWFFDETRRVYDYFAIKPKESERQELLEVIGKFGGSITARELARAKRCYRVPGAAREALDKLVKRDLGRWQQSAQPGCRVTATFVLELDEEHEEW